MRTPDLKPGLSLSSLARLSTVSPFTPDPRSTPPYQAWYQPIHASPSTALPLPWRPLPNRQRPPVPSTRRPPSPPEQPQISPLATPDLASLHLYPPQCALRTRQIHLKPPQPLLCDPPDRLQHPPPRSSATLLPRSSRPEVGGTPPTPSSYSKSR
ncbi:hypothetical protein BDZ85DRAFT_16216 [Elsinoe ampelina]|uniref:Uncharacterized protein n=1 Tax=Elsinoe ampelina TaxID=302913 RepID=A0A6A6G727_9PEZI|nr:hypothetical protein BDZ85DRAFT_16216 [Elsinoe ampelina]